MTIQRPPQVTRRIHGHIEDPKPNAWQTVYDIVCAIPCGRVMTYGQISTLLGGRISPLAVGWALHVCPDDVPWHRVVNASGRCSTNRLAHLPPGLQQKLLEAEGVKFSIDGSLDLKIMLHYPNQCLD